MDTNKNETALQDTPEKKEPEIFLQEEIKDSFMNNETENPGTVDTPLNTNPRKASMLHALLKCFGVVSYAAMEAGISRKTHYNWMETDREYRLAVERIDEATIDYCEAKLFKHVQKGDLQAAMFFLRHKGKSRGYTTKQETRPEPRPEPEQQKIVVNYHVKDQQTVDMIKSVREMP